MTQQQRDWCVVTINKCYGDTDLEYRGQYSYAYYLELCLKLNEVPK